MLYYGEPQFYTQAGREMLFSVKAHILSDYLTVFAMLRSRSLCSMNTYNALMRLFQNYLWVFGNCLFIFYRIIGVMSAYIWVLI